MPTGNLIARMTLLLQSQGEAWLQGYLAHEKAPPRGTLQQPYAHGRMVVLRGGRFLMSEVPLQDVPPRGERRAGPSYRGPRSSEIAPPPRTAIGA